MKTASRTALVACLATALGISALAPVHAQGPDGNRGPGFGVQRVEQGNGPAFRPGGNQQMNHPGILSELIAARNAEAIDVAAVRLSHRLDLTDAQAALLETLKTDALAAQGELSAAREAIRPIDETDAERPDLTARYAGLVAMTTARAEAMAAIQPAFEAFVESLTDAQLERLGPDQRGPGRHGPHAGFGQRPNG